MKIGIDVDDTLANTSVLLYEEISKNKAFLEHIPNLEGQMKNIMRGVIPEELEEYMPDVPQMLSEVYRKDAANTVVSSLKKNHEIYIITSRSEDVMKIDPYLFTKEWLDQNEIPYDHIICNAGDKLDVCIKHKIDVMIDDSIYIGELLDKNGIRGIVFNSPVNVEQQTHLTRVNNWKELKELLKEEC